jgi:hypothetical protein
MTRREICFDIPFPREVSLQKLTLGLFEILTVDYELPKIHLGDIRSR